MNRLSHILIFICMLLPLCGCHHSSEKDEVALTDSLLTQYESLLINKPQEAYPKLLSLQNELTDSACWWRLEVYKATATHLMGKTDEADRMYRAAMGWCRTHEGNEWLEGELWNHLGVNEHIKGNMKPALEFYEKARKCHEARPKDKKSLNIALNMADACMQMGQMGKSAAYYHYALFLCDSLGLKDMRYSIYSGLGQVSMELENFGMAHRYFNLAAKDLDKMPKDKQLFYYMSLGNCFYYEARYNEANGAFRQALDISRQIQSRTQELLCYGNMAEVYLMQDSTQRADEMLRRSFQMKREMELMPAQIQFYFQSLQADLDIAQNRFDKARTLLHQNADSIMAQSPRYLMLHYRRLQHYAVRAGRWKEAYEMQSKSNAYADSLNSRQSRFNVQELRERYARDTTLLRQKIALSDYKGKAAKQRYLILFIVAAALTLALAYTLMIFMYRRRTEARLKKQMERITALRMNVVRNRVSPHYIFNVLGTVLPKLQRYPDAVGPVDMLIDVLRGSLLASDKVAVPVNDELQLVKRYIELYHYSHGNHPNVTWEVDKELTQHNIPVLSMALQIPVENALKHAFPEQKEEDTIHIAVMKRENDLVLSVTDNGLGYRPGSVPNSDRDTGTGLLLINRTLHILNQYNKREASFHIANLAAPQHGTHVELVLPIDYQFTTQN